MFCVIRGEIVTAPVSGILPGITREVVMEIAQVREAILDGPAWRSAAEIFVTSAVRVSFRSSGATGATSACHRDR